MGSSRGPHAKEGRGSGFAEYSAQKAFLHSHSYTGNPLACAAALATLDIFRDDDVLARNKTLAAHMARATARLADHPHVAEVRQTGMILAVEMVRDKKHVRPIRGRNGAGVSYISTRYRAARCCARSATWFTSCRRT